jgi:hypothetical protein
MQTRKQTAWKKSRKFGDVMGGRMRPKLTDNILNREHSLLPPTEGQEMPIFIVDNPSKDFYFPVTIEDIKATLNILPIEHRKFLTHIWLQKVKKNDYLTGEMPQGAFICGSKVYLIKLYAIPKNNKMAFGQVKPSNKALTFYKPYCTDLRHEKNGWYLQWDNDNMKKYFLEKLLLHEIGHCVDYIYQRDWSKANAKQIEDFADNYAVIWRNHISSKIQ